MVSWCHPSGGTVAADEVWKTDLPPLLEGWMVEMHPMFGDFDPPPLAAAKLRSAREPAAKASGTEACYCSPDEER
jgi:hypothetical protein